MTTQTAVLVYDGWPYQHVVVEAETPKCYRVRAQGGEIRQPLAGNGVRITLRSGTVLVAKHRVRLLRRNVYGVSVQCAVCGKTKAPVGRSVPPCLYLCESALECDGHRQDPQVGSLWPNESEADFGYPVADVGTRERAS